MRVMNKNFLVCLLTNANEPRHAASPSPSPARDCGPLKVAPDPVALLARTLPASIASRSRSRVQATRYGLRWLRLMTSPRLLGLETLRANRVELFNGSPRAIKSRDTTAHFTTFTLTRTHKSLDKKAFYGSQRVIIKSQFHVRFSPGSASAVAARLLRFIPPIGSSRLPLRPRPPEEGSCLF